MMIKKKKETGTGCEQTVLKYTDGGIDTSEHDVHSMQTHWGQRRRGLLRAENKLFLHHRSERGKRKTENTTHIFFCFLSENLKEQMKRQLCFFDPSTWMTTVLGC